MNLVCICISGPQQFLQIVSWWRFNAKKWQGPTVWKLHGLLETIKAKKENTPLYQSGKMMFKQILLQSKMILLNSRVLIEEQSFSEI